MTIAESVPALTSVGASVHRIIVEAGPSRGGAASLAWATADLTTRPADRIVICHASGSPIPVRSNLDDLELFDPRFARQVRQVRQDIGGDRVEARVTTGRAATELLRDARPADTVVIPAPPLGSARTATSLAANATGVVVAVRPSTPPPAVTAGLFAGHVIIGVLDGISDASTIAYAFDYADRHHLPVAMVHADEPADIGVWSDDESDPRPIGHQFGLDLLDAACAGVRQRHPDVPVRSFLLRERAAESLERASKGAMLVVVGDRGRSAVIRGVLGSVSRHLIRHAHCAVAVVHDGPAGPR